MDLLAANAQWVLLVCGLLTGSMVFAVLDPNGVLRSMFGEGVDGPLAATIVRSWGAMIALNGAALTWAAFHPEGRSVLLPLVGAGKLAFIALVLAQGRRWRKKAALTLVIDGVMVALFAALMASA